MNKAEQIKSLLYSYSEWEIISNKPQPHHIEIEKNGQWMYYFGANHSHDPQNFQYLALKKYWESFLEKTGGKNTVVLVESGLRPVHKNESAAIIKDAENGYITLLAHQTETPVESADPDRYEERQELTRQFTKEEVQYYYFSRMVNQWLNLPEPKSDFKEYLTKYLKWNKKESRWSDFEFTLENMERIHRSIFGTNFNYKDKGFFESIQHPVILKSVINRIKIASSQFRDTRIVARIEELWQEGKSIFVVFGAAHLILQERALRELLK